MLIDLQGEGPIMWQGWDTNSETPIFKMTVNDGVVLLESAIERCELQRQAAYSSGVTADSGEKAADAIADWRDWGNAQDDLISAIVRCMEVAA